MPTRIYWIHTLTPTHTGIGRGIGYIDLPIDRDGVTGWPILRGSALKGVLADYYKATETDRAQQPLAQAAFGIAGADETGNSGSLILTDAHLVCLPVRSFRGTFAWITSPLALQMLRRMLELAGAKNLSDIPKVDQEHILLHIQNAILLENNKVYLEELDLEGQTCEHANKWAEYISHHVFGNNNLWYQEFHKRFAVVHDFVFDFFCQSGTEVLTRVRIDDDTKTVVEGALWTEENLPAETIFAGLVQCERVFRADGLARNDITPEKLVEKYVTGQHTLQIGGKATVGRGLIRCIFTEA